MKKHSSRHLTVFTPLGGLEIPLFVDDTQIVYTKIITC